MEVRLAGREALAMFEDLPPEPTAPKVSTPAPVAGGQSATPTTGNTAASPPAPAEASVPAAGNPSPPSTDSPSAAAGDAAPKSAAFRALAEGQAKLRREQQAFDSQRAEAQSIVDWYKAVQADPSKLAEKLGADIFERGARIAAGAPPKPQDPNDRVAALEQQLAEDRRQRETYVAQAQTVQAHATVRGMLEKAGDGFGAVLALNRQNEVFDGFSLYLRNAGIQTQNGRYFDRDGTPLAENFEHELVTTIGREVNKQIVQEYGSLVEKVPELRSRFAPAPAAAAPAVATPAAPPQAATPPAREASAPATITGRHVSDAAPSVSNGRRMKVSEVDDEILGRYFGQSA